MIERIGRSRSPECAPEAANGFRWTAGDAGLHEGVLASFVGPLEVELHIGCTALYQVAEVPDRLAACG